VDPLRRRLLWQEIRTLADDGATVLLVTHNVLEAERVVDRLAVINDGRMIAQGTPAALKAEQRDRLRLEVTVEPRAELPAFPEYLAEPVRIGRRALTTLAEGDAAHALEWVRGLASTGAIEEFELGATSLEDTYVRLVGPGAAAEGSEEASGG
jgi:ABC-2 type transport system ATP-binding protein